MATGVVKWFNSAKGYGYITGYDGAEIYFHSTSINDPDGGSAWCPGTHVEFDLIETRIGFEATNVIRCAAA
jgi:cold shock protein